MSEYWQNRYSLYHALLIKEHNLFQTAATKAILTSRAALLAPFVSGSRTCTTASDRYLEQALTALDGAQAAYGHALKCSLDTARLREKKEFEARKPPPPQRQHSE